MDFSYIDDPQWAEQSREQKQSLINMALQVDVMSDPEWASFDDNTKRGIADLYVRKAHEYSYQKETESTPERGAIMDTISHGARGLLSAGKGITGAMRMADSDPRKEEGVIANIGKYVSDYLDTAKENYNIFKPDRSELQQKDGLLKKGWTGAVESAPASLVPLVAGAAGGMAFGPVGAVIGAGATLFGTFGVGQYQNTYDETVAALRKRGGMTEDQIHEAAHKHSLTSATAEVGGEAVSDLASLAFFGVFGKQAVKQGVKQTIKQVLSEGGVKEFGKALAKSIPFEVGSEMGTGYVQAKSANEIGISDQTPGQAMKESALPAVFMSLMFGGSIRGLQAIEAKSIYTSLNSENKGERVKAAQQVAGRLDQEERGLWVDTANKFIQSGEDIPISQPIVDLATQQSETIKNVSANPQNIDTATPDQDIANAQTVDQALEQFQKGLLTIPNIPETNEGAWADIQSEENYWADQANEIKRQRNPLPPLPKQKPTRQQTNQTAMDVAAAVGEQNIPETNSGAWASLQEKETADFMQKIDLMQSEVNNTQTRGVTQEKANQQSETVVYGSNSPQWMRDLPKDKDGRVYGRSSLNAVFDNLRAGKKLTERQQTLYEHIKNAMNSYQGEAGEMAAQDEFEDMQKKGFDVLGNQKMAVANLKEGDTFVGTVDGVKDEFKVKDTNADGETLLQDGIAKRVDMFDEVTVNGIKRGKSADTKPLPGKVDDGIQDGVDIEGGKTESTEETPYEKILETVPDTDGFISIFREKGIPASKILSDMRNSGEMDAETLTAYERLKNRQKAIGIENPLDYYSTLTDTETAGTKSDILKATDGVKGNPQTAALHKLFVSGEELTNRDRANIKRLIVHQKEFGDPSAKYLESVYKDHVNGNPIANATNPSPKPQKNTTKPTEQASTEQGESGDIDTEFVRSLPGYRYLETLPPTTMQTFGIDDKLLKEASESEGLEPDSTEEFISLKNEAGTRTPESILNEISDIESVIQQAVGMIRRGGKAARNPIASTKGVVRNFRRVGRLKKALQEWFNNYPGGLEAYTSRQNDLAKLERGDVVLAPYPTPDNQYGSEWEVVRKNKKTWSLKNIENPHSTALIPPVALRPIPTKEQNQATTEQAKDVPDQKQPTPKPPVTGENVTGREQSRQTVPTQEDVETAKDPEIAEDLDKDLAEDGPTEAELDAMFENGDFKYQTTQDLTNPKNPAKTKLVTNSQGKADISTVKTPAADGGDLSKITYLEEPDFTGNGFSKDLIKVEYSGPVYHAAELEGLDYLLRNEIHGENITSTINSSSFFDRSILVQYKPKKRIGKYTPYDADSGKNHGYDEFRTSDLEESEIEKIYLDDNLLGIWETPEVELTNLSESEGEIYDILYEIAEDYSLKFDSIKNVEKDKARFLSPNQSSTPAEGVQYTLDQSGQPDKLTGKAKLKALYQARNKNGRILDERRDTYRLRSGRTVREKFLGLLGARDETGKTYTIPTFSKQQRQIGKIAEGLGLKAVFFRTDEYNNIEGFTSPKDGNEIYLNKNGRHLLSITSHEWIHQLRANHPDLYDSLVDTINVSDEKFQAFYDEQLSSREGDFTGLNMEADEVMEELIAHFVGDQSVKTKFWEKLFKENPTLTEKLFNIIKDVLSKIKSYVTRGEQYISNVEELQDAVVKAYSDAIKRGNKADSVTGDTKAQAVRNVVTAAFKKWFGDSVVTVDGKAGSEPLRVFHGSPTVKNLTSFIKNIKGLAGWFSESPDYAEHYTDKKIFGTKDNGGIVPVYLNIANPFDLSGIDMGSRMKLTDLLSAGGLSVTQIKPIVASIKKTASFPENVNRPKVAWQHVQQAEGNLARHLADIGFDGIKQIENGVLSYAAFNPTQIKSIYNKGTFDPNNPDIRYQTGDREHDGQAKIEKIMSDLRKASTTKSAKVKADTAKEQKMIEEYRKLEILAKDSKSSIATKQKMLASFLKILPENVRAKVITPLSFISRYSNIKTHKKRIDEALAVTEKALVDYLRRNLVADIHKGSNANKLAKNRIKKSTIGHEASRDLQFIRETLSDKNTELSMARVENQLSKKEEELEEADEAKAKIIEEEISNLESQRNIIETFGNLKSQKLEDLLFAKEALSSIVSNGRALWRAQQEEFKKSLEPVIENVQKDISGQEEPTLETSAGSTKKAVERDTKWGKAKGTWDAVENSILSWEFLMDKVSKLSGSKILKSYTTKNMGDVVQSATREENSLNLETDESIHENAKRIFNADSDKDLNKKFMEHEVKQTGKVFSYTEDGKQIEDFAISQMEAAYMYAVRKNDDSLPTFEKMGMTEKTFEDIENFIGPELKEWVDYNVDEYLQDFHFSVNEVYRQVYGTNLTKTPGYISWYRDVPGKVQDKGIAASPHETGTKGMSKGAFKERVKNTNPYRFVSFNDVLTRHVSEMNNFKAWAMPTKIINGVFNNRMTQRLITQNHSVNMRTAIKSFQTDFTKSPLEMRGEMAWLDKLRGNITTAMTALNPTIFLKQLTSIPAMAESIPTSEWIKHEVDFWKNPLKAWNLLKDSKHWESRRTKGMERDIRTAQAVSGSQAVANFRNLKNRAMFLVKWGDGAAILVGGYPVYKYHFDKNVATLGRNKAHKLALAEFETSMDRTQQASGIKDQGKFQRSGSYAKLFSMFLTSPKQYTSQITAAIRKIHSDPRDGDAYKRLFIFGVMMPSLFQATASGLIGLIGGDEEDEDKFIADQVKAILQSPLNGIPIIRDLQKGVWDSAMGEWYGTDVEYSPVTSAGQSLLSAVFNGAKLLSGDTEGKDKKLEKTLNSLFETVGYAYGFPIESVRKMFMENWADIVNDKTYYPFRRAIGFSRYATGEQGDKFSRTKKRLKKIKTEYDEAENKFKFFSENRESLNDWSRINKLQTLLNNNTKVINKLKKRPPSERTDTMIGTLEKRNEEIKKRYFSK